MRCQRLYPIAALFLVPLLAFSQPRLMRQQHFKKHIPAGNYSGITPLGNERYAVVSDKSKEDGFFVFRLHIDTLQGIITKAENEGFYSCGQKNRDMEGIVYCPHTRTLFICGEGDNAVYEYTLEGQRTGRQLEMPNCFKSAPRNLGLEALTYDTLRHRFYITSERLLPGDSLLRLQSFGDNLKPDRQYFYQPDKPISRKYYHGVSELCATGDGRLLVMERQLRVPRLKIGAKSIVRIYEVEPKENSFLEKRLLTEFTTRISLTSRRFANYEGLCTPYQGWLLLVADSQNQYKGILRDWFKLIAE